jgi:uncharacterized membrane protein
MEAFSDGVIAIAITLLVLQIEIPQVEMTIGDDALGQALLRQWPAYIGYVISFATIGLIWATHHNIFRYIDYTDSRLLLLNMLFLFCVAFIPFPSAVLAEHLNHDGERLATFFYAGWFFLTAMVLRSLWGYVQSDNGHLLVDDMDPALMNSITRRFNLGPVGYLIAMIVTLFFPLAGLGILLFLAIYYLLPQP